MGYIIEAVHWEEKIKSKKQEFRHLFEKVDIRYWNPTIEE